MECLTVGQLKEILAKADDDLLVLTLDRGTVGEVWGEVNSKEYYDGLDDKKHFVLNVYT